MKKTFFSTPAFLLVIIVLTMYNNLEHGAELYYKITKSIYPESRQTYLYWQSYFVIIVIDLAVIGFIVNGKTKDSKAFAWLLFVINCIFWNVLSEISNMYYNDVEQISMLLAKVFFSAAFSYLIHKVSTLYFEKINGFSSIEQIQAELEQSRAEKKQLEAVIYNYEEVNEQFKAENNQLEAAKRELKKDLINSQLELTKILVEFTCPICKTYEADHTKGLHVALRALAAHKGACKEHEHITENKCVSSELKFSEQN